MSSEPLTRQALIEQARRCDFFQGALRELARELPLEDADLNATIAEAVAARDERAFRSLFYAAIGTGRHVDGRHLAEGSALFGAPDQLLCAARSCSGDVAAALLAAVQGGRMGCEREALALVVAQLWSEDRQAALPPGFLATARSFARRTADNVFAQTNLAVLARLSKDKQLLCILDAHEMPATGRLVEATEQSFRNWFQGPPWKAVPEQRPPVMLSGYTVRRAVPRVGRNDPCPCGSGKKYKKCCFAKDQLRLLQSSAVAGLTLDEWRHQPELALTAERLSQMRSYEVVKLDPARVSPDLHEHLLDRLLIFKEHDAIVRFFETVGYHDSLEFYWDWAVETAGTDRETEIIRRLLALRPGLDPATLPLKVRLLLADTQGAALLDLVETEARRALQAEDSPDELASMAYSLLESRVPALGVLVARSLLPIVGPWEGEFLLDALLQARDKLELGSDEPFETIFQERFAGEPDEPRESEALAAVRLDLDAKTSEVQRLRAELKNIYREMEKRRQRAAVAPAEPRPAPADDASMADLRTKVSSLRGLLKERHTERNQLRRELQLARDQLAAIPPPAASPASPQDTDAPEREDDLLLAESDLGRQPVRIPEFSPKFAHATAGLPRFAVRAALVLVARLAAGETSAFAGVRRLRAWPDVYRQRVGSDYRLLFRLPEDRVDVVDLINRRDLERTLKCRP